MKIKLESSAFGQGELIPLKHTGDDKDVSPPLRWSWAPKECKSIALIFEDPDAPISTWVHWVIFNIPADANSLPEGVPTDKILAGSGIKQGVNDFGWYGYGGPCPPKGTEHRYFFKIYALDAMLDLDAGATKSDLLNAMAGHILTQGELMGKYKR